LGDLAYASLGEAVGEHQWLGVGEEAREGGMGQVGKMKME
jgi:hypothetical protein